MSVVVYANDAEFLPSVYGDGTIHKFSTIREVQVDNYIPQWINFRLKMLKLEDQSSYLQYGDPDEIYYYSHDLPIQQPTSWNTFPTQDDPDALYKFASINMFLNHDLQIHFRKTYGFLDWLGDVGGFGGAVFAIAALLNSANSDFALKAKLMSIVARVQPEN